MINHIIYKVQPVISGYRPEISDYVKTAEHGLYKTRK